MNDKTIFKRLCTDLLFIPLIPLHGEGKPRNENCGMFVIDFALVLCYAIPLQGFALLSGEHRLLYSI